MTAPKYINNLKLMCDNFSIKTIKRQDNVYNRKEKLRKQLEELGVEVEEFKSSGVDSEPLENGPPVAEIPKKKEEP